MVHQRKPTASMIVVSSIVACSVSGPVGESQGGQGGAAQGGSGSTTMECADTEILALEESAASLETLAFARRANVAAACHAIATDLKLSPAPLPATLTAADVQSACVTAAEAVRAKVTSVGSTSVSFRAPTCTSDQSVEESCRATCGASAACGDACVAQLDLGASCTLPDVSVFVMGTVSTAYVSSLEEHLPLLLQVRAWSEHVLPGVRALENALARIDPSAVDASCVAHWEAGSRDASLGVDSTESTLQAMQPIFLELDL